MEKTKTYYLKKDFLKTVFGIVLLTIFDLFYTIVFYVFAFGILRLLNLLPQKLKPGFGSACLFLLIFSGVATAFSIGFAGDKNAKETFGLNFDNLILPFGIITVLLFIVFLAWMILKF